MTTLTEKIRALAEEFEKRAASPHLRRVAKPVLLEKCARDLRVLLASASTPEETGDLADLVDDYAGLVREANDPEIEGGVPAAAARALDARASLLSAIASSVSAAREEGARIALRFKAGWSPDHAREMGRIVANSLSPTKDQE